MSYESLSNADQEKQHYYLDSIWYADTQNEIFQSLMQAMSRPGSIHNLESRLGKSNAVTAVLATLFDAQVTACNHDSLITDEDWSLSQCQTVSSDAANYIICDGSLPCSINPNLGSLVSPELSGTVIVSVNNLSNEITDTSKEERLWRLSGPGVDGEIDVVVSDLHSSWLQQRENWNSEFPLGADLIVVSETSVLALPRTTKVECLT
ncbi:phosphonate C-P lyase system protein PhnH [Arenicella sp. 4NH20-0111]